MARNIPNSESQYEDEAFEGLFFAKAELERSHFYGCTFEEGVLRESVLRECRFIECVFRGCDLSLAQVFGSAFSSSRFERCQVVGVNWTHAEWGDDGLKMPAGYFDSALNHSTFLGLNLKGISIVDCAAADVDFRDANLRQADFGGTDLSGSLFNHTDLTDADLSRARDYRIDPSQNTLRNAKFSLPEALSLLYSMDIRLIDSP